MKNFIASWRLRSQKQIRLQVRLNCSTESTRKLTSEKEHVFQGASLIAALAQSEEAMQIQLQVWVMQAQSNSPNSS